MSRNSLRMDRDWETPENFDWLHVQVEVLMDIREELKRIRNVLECPNFQAIPHQVGRVAIINTTRKRLKARK